MFKRNVVVALLCLVSIATLAIPSDASAVEYEVIVWNRVTQELVDGCQIVWLKDGNQVGTDWTEAGSVFREMTPAVSWGAILDSHAMDPIPFTSSQTEDPETVIIFWSISGMSD